MAESSRKLRARPNLPEGPKNFLLLQIFYLVKLFVWLAKRLPEKRMKVLTQMIFLPAARYNQKLCKRNMTSVFQAAGKTPSDIERLYAAYLKYMVRFQVETARCFTIEFEGLKKKVVLHGEEHLRAALERKRGVLLAGVHMGTWWHMPCLLGAQGHKLGVVFNSFPYAAIENYLSGHARRYGIDLTFVDKGVPGLMRRAAQQNEIVYLTFDVAVRKGHANWVPFGHTKININAGPAILALRNQMPVLYVSSFHGPEHSHLIIHPELTAPLAQNLQGADQLCRILAEKFNADLVRHPEQWWGWGVSDLPRVRVRKEVSSEAISPAPSEPVNR
jgi:lauroyl/myristoyl acyltransferase